MALIEVQQLVKEFRSPKRQPGLGVVSARYSPAKKTLSEPSMM